MRTALALLIGIVVAPLAQAADVEAGNAKAATVCAACHGATGISTSESIPHLAAQRAGYLAAQLRALKDGTRKNPMMNAIASQLSAEDIANLAAYFAAQPGAQANAKSALLPGSHGDHRTAREKFDEKCRQPGATAFKGPRRAAEKF